VQQLHELLVAGLGDALGLLALPLPELTDPRPVLLLEEGVVDAAREDLHVDHVAGHSRGNAQRRVLHVLRLLAEDRGEELLFRRELRLPLRRDLPAEDVPGLDPGPIRTIPRSSRSTSASSETFGISRVISSMPRLVSRTWSSSSWMWIDVSSRPFTSRSERTIASSKLYPNQGMKATVRFRPQRELAVIRRGTVGDDLPGLDLCPSFATSGRWLIAVSWFVLQNFFRR
jgi:hypothetical protein